MICPRLSYGKDGIIECFKDQCIMFNSKYGCLESYELLCNIKNFEYEQKILKKELKPISDIAII